MKPQVPWVMGVATFLVAASLVSVRNSSATLPLLGDPEDTADPYQEELRAAEVSRSKDPAWKPTSAETGVIHVGGGKSPGILKNFSLDGEGNVLACVAPPPESGSPGIRVYSPEGALLRTLPLKIRPGAIDVAPDGSIYVAGSGMVLHLDASGRELAAAASPVVDLPVAISGELEEFIQESARETRRPPEEVRKEMLENLERRRAEVTGLAVSGEDVFLAVPTPDEFTYRVYRFGPGLANPQLVVEKLRGCCGQMDIQALAGELWISHNARHTVERRDRDGKLVSKFGKAGKVRPADFGGCCEPKNLCVLSGDELLVAESGPPTCIKRFSADGRFIEVVAILKGKGECVRVSVAASPDGRKFYLMDTAADAIRIYTNERSSPE